MIQKIILKLSFQKTTYKLADVELATISQLKEFANNKFGDQIQDCVYNAKFEDRTEQIVSDGDILKSINLATSNKKGMKVLHIKLKQSGKDEQKPIESKGVDYPEDPTMQPVCKELQKAIDDNWKFMINRVKQQYDDISKAEGYKMYGKTDKVIAFTDGKYKLYTGSEEEAFDAILDHPDNIAAVWFMKLYDPTKKTTAPVVLQVYADYSVQLWSDPETTLLAWGWIKPDNGTNVAVYLNFEEYDNYETETIKLTLQQELMKCVNQIDKKEFYCLPCTAPFGVIPSHSFAQPMKADGLFFARCRNRGKVTTIKGTVIHPSIKKAGEFCTIKRNSTGDVYMRFAKQAYQFDHTDSKNVEVCWKNWNLLTQDQKDQLKEKSKQNAYEKCKKEGYDKEHPLQNFQSYQRKS